MKENTRPRKKDSFLFTLFLEFSYVFQVGAFTSVGFLLAFLDSQNTKMITVLAFLVPLFLMSRSVALIASGDRLKIKTQLMEWLIEGGIVMFISAAQVDGPAYAAIYLLLGVIMHYAYLIFVFIRVVNYTQEK